MKRRPKILLFLILLLLEGFFSFEEKCWAANGVIINEVMYNPAGTDNAKDKQTTYEWVELKNISDNLQNVSDWQLRADTYYSLSALTAPIPKNGYIVVFEGFGENKNVDFLNGNVAYLYMNKEGNRLGDSTGGDISLYNNSSATKDTIVDYVAYGKTKITTNYTHAITVNIWTTNDFVINSPEDYSVEIISEHTKTNASLDWQKSYATGGTPGKENSKKEIVEENKPEEKLFPSAKIKLFCRKYIRLPVNLWKWKILELKRAIWLNGK